MSTTINGIDAYEVDKAGVVQSFIRVEGLPAKDVALFDAAETAAALVSGSQEVDVGGVRVGGDSTGLANDATSYTATVNIDGVDNAVAVTGSLAQTYTALLSEINADLSGATAALVGGNIVITSASSGNDSKIVITDVDLFSTLTDFVAINAAVDGNLKTYLMSAVQPSTGKYLWDVYAQAVEVYDPGSFPEILKVSLSDIVGAPAEADHNLLISHINALRDAINDLHR